VKYLTALIVIIITGGMVLWVPLAVCLMAIAWIFAGILMLLSFLYDAFGPIGLPLLGIGLWLITWRVLCYATKNLS